MPYKYVVDVDSRPFKGAPDVLLRALGRLTWATKNTVAEGEFRRPNELLTLGYFDKMSIGVSRKFFVFYILGTLLICRQYHDDGEESLGPTVATLSLGTKAVMSIRMKDKYFNGFTSKQTANIRPLDNDPFLPGCARYTEKIELRRRLQAGEITQATYEFELKELLRTISKKEASPCIVMELQHGDLAVMHGESLQKYYEVRLVHHPRYIYILWILIKY